FLGRCGRGRLSSGASGWEGSLGGTLVLRRTGIASVGPGRTNRTRPREEPRVAGRKPYELTLPGHLIVLSSSHMPRFLAALLFAFVLSSAAQVKAQDAVEKQVALLKSSEDFRVRTQAALALGASKDKRAL